MKLLITGAASGIGRACTEFYSSEDVTGIDRQDLDLNDCSAVSDYIDACNDFDVMIYCAGIREIEAPHRLSYQTWQNVLNVNLNACFLFSQGLIKKALSCRRPLTIVNIASVSGFQAESDRAAYVSSKYAMIGLTKQLAWQYGREGIRVNAIAPGIVETPLTRSYFEDEVSAERIKSAIPLGYWGGTENIVSLVDVCITNNYINGAVMVCDGGWTIGRNI